MDSRTLLEAKMSASPLNLLGCPRWGCRHYMYSVLLVFCAGLLAHPSPSPRHSPQDSQIRAFLSAGYSEEKEGVFYGNLCFWKDPVQ